jgi:hypothetical protein
MDDIPFSSNFLPRSIRNTIRYLCTLTSPLTSIHHHLPMNSLRPLFRLLFASARASAIVYPFFLVGFWIGYCHITSKHYKHKTVHTSHNGVVVLMDVHEIQKSFLGFTQTTAAEQINWQLGKELSTPDMDTHTVTSPTSTHGPDVPGAGMFPSLACQMPIMANAPRKVSISIPLR